MHIGARVNGAERVEQGLGERQNIRAAVAEGERLERENIQAKEQVFAEISSFYAGGKIDIRKGDDSGFDAQGFVAAEALKDALLQNAQELALRSGRQGGNFVEHDGAGAAELEASKFALDGSGEGAAFVAEEFALDELRRKTGAINFEEGRVAARPKFVNEAREMVLTGAAFSGDEQGGGSGGNFLREFEETDGSGIFGDPRQSLDRHQETASSAV
jgi:hypothetical protein